MKENMKSSVIQHSTVSTAHSKDPVFVFDGVFSTNYHD